MTEWMTPALVTGVSALVGAMLLVRAGGANTLPQPEVASREDLIKRRDTLYQALRDLPMERARMSADAFAEEQDRLERDAAAVLRQLDKMTAPTAAASPAGPSFSERHPQLSGALLGGAVVAAIAAIATGLPALDSAPTPTPSMMGASGGDAVAQQIAELQAVVTANPDNLEAKNRLGHLYILKDQVMEAWALAEAVTKVAPQDPEARTHQAVVLIASGHADVAAEVLDKVLAVDPNFVEALGYRGAVYREQGELQKAVDMWKRLLTIDPAQARVVEPAILALEQKIAGGGATVAAAAPTAALTADPAARISGTVTLDPALASQVKPTDVLFINVRPEGVDRGPPVAAERHAASGFPISFDLGPEDSPMGGTMAGKVTLSARIDQDGNAMTREAGALEAKVTLAVGSSGVTLVLAPPG